jgi:hypothetical protein
MQFITNYAECTSIGLGFIHLEECLTYTQQTITKNVLGSGGGKMAGCKFALCNFVE